jgi:hypothetical protein
MMKKNTHNKTKRSHIMKKTFATILVAAAVLGFGSTSFAGNGGSINQGNSLSDDLLLLINDQSSVVTNTQNNPSVTVGDISAAIASATAPAFVTQGDIAYAVASATQASSFPVLEWVVTPIVAAGVGYGDANGSDGMTIGNINVGGAVGSGVGANIGGAVFESINTATAIAINGTLGN